MSGTDGTRTTLFDIVREYQDALADLNEVDLPPNVVLDTLEAIQAPVEEKVRAVVAYALQIKADASARKEQAARMKESAAAMEARYESLMRYAQIGLMNSGLRMPLVCPEFTLNVAKNPQSVEVTVDPSNLPPEYTRRTLVVDIPKAWTAEQLAAVEDDLKGRGLDPGVLCEPDKKALSDALKADPEKHAAYARLSAINYRLTVR